MKKSFTLIELMVVVLIIMLLSGLVIVNVKEARARARNAKRKSDLSAVASALQSYYADNHSYPSTAGLGCPGNWCGEPYPGSPYGTGRDYTGPNGYVPNLAPNYINRLPVDPSRNAANQCGTDSRSYLYKSDGTRFKLLALCTPEGTWDSTDPFYDPVRTTTTWQISSDGTALTTY